MSFSVREERLFMDQPDLWFRDAGKQILVLSRFSFEFFSFSFLSKKGVPFSKFCNFVGFLWKCLLYHSFEVLRNANAV